MSLPGSPRCTTHQDTEAEAHCARCGDFLCRLCGPLEPVPLCARCALKTTLEFEEPGEHSLARAFYVTARDAVDSPRRMGKRLGGSGNVLSALAFVTLCGQLGLVPLALLLAARVLYVVDPVRVGLRSTGMLSVGPGLVLAALASATLLALTVSVGAGLLWVAARTLRIGVRFDVLLRALSYGMSLIALPVLGPLLSPVAGVQALIAVHAVLEARAPGTRTWFVLALALLLGLACALALVAPLAWA